MTSQQGSKHLYLTYVLSERPSSLNSLTNSMASSSFLALQSTVVPGLSKVIPPNFYNPTGILSSPQSIRFYLDDTRQFQIYNNTSIGVFIWIRDLDT